MTHLHETVNSAHTVLIVDPGREREEIRRENIPSEPYDGNNQMVTDMSELPPESLRRENKQIGPDMQEKSPDKYCIGKNTNQIRSETRHIKCETRHIKCETRHIRCETRYIRSKSKEIGRGKKYIHPVSDYIQ